MISYCAECFPYEGLEREYLAHNYEEPESEECGRVHGQFPPPHPFLTQQHKDLMGVGVKSQDMMNHQTRSCRINQHNSYYVYPCDSKQRRVCIEHSGILGRGRCALRRTVIFP